MFDFSTFEERLRSLEPCGICLNPEVRAQSLLLSMSPEFYERQPFQMILIAMGSGEERLSDGIWYFDTECISGDGSYRSIAVRMRTLARGDLPLEDIDDYVDIEDGTAWLSFRLDGKYEKWEARVDRDWVDSSILSRLARLLESRATGRRFTYIDTMSQCCLIGCATEEEKAQLEKISGLRVQWLK